MKMKLWLYIGFFAVFTFVFTQAAFPFSARVKSISVRSAESSESIQVFNKISDNAAKTQEAAYEHLVKDAELKDANNYHFIEYEIGIESTRLIPIDILGSEIAVDDKYKNRVIVRTAEPYEKEVSAMKPSSKKFRLLTETGGMSQDEIHEMIRNIQIRVAWKAMPGWERENKVYLPEGIIVNQ